MSGHVPTTDPLFPSRWLEIAETVCARYYTEFPEQDERYGNRGRTYCVHDNAYLVAWLVGALEDAGTDSFGSNVAWLRSVLESRGFPMDAFGRNLDLVGEAVGAVRPGDADRIRDLVAAARSEGPAR